MLEDALSHRAPTLVNSRPGGNFRLPQFFPARYGGVMHILVTGGAGFIGSHFVEKCLAGGHVAAVLDDFNDFYDPSIKRANIANFKAEVPVHEADIRDADTVARIVREGRFDAIVHLAAR